MLGATFKRIQFTPDTTPAELTGINTLRMGEQVFFPGSVFTNVLLADENSEYQMLDLPHKGVAPDMPSAWTPSIVQDFTDSPFTSTVHAPHEEVSQPTFVPVSPSRSRNT